jgi:hypothetical protein
MDVLWGYGFLRFEVERDHPGRIVAVQADGTLYASRGYEIWRSRDDGVGWTRVTSLPRSPWRRLAERSRLASRLLRQEVRALAVLGDDACVAANREGVFFGRAGAASMQPSAIETGELPLLPPMSLSVGPGGRVVFGEYGCPRPRRPMRLYVSDDGGASFRIARTFPTGEILHVHNLVWDAARGHWWLLSGDHDTEPGVGMLSADLAHFEWLVKGSQLHRAVEVFDLGDHLLYATDSHVETNALIRLEKSSGRLERLRDFEGSCIYACRFGGLFALTTTVEPSPVITTDRSTLWLSRDAEKWQPALAARKDRWHPNYFQYGSLVLPRGHSDREVIAVSGQAVERWDGRVLVGHVVEGDGT